MANNNKKKGKLQNTKNNIPPNLNSISSAKGSRFTHAQSTYFQEQRRALIENQTPNIGANGPYRGIVLRADHYTKENIPVGTWLEVYYNHMARNLPAEEIPEGIWSYKVLIPELHSMLPPIKIYPNHSIACDEHSKISLYPSFISQSGDNNPESRPLAGEVVWVDFVDKANHQDGIYIGKAFKCPTTVPQSQACKDAMQIMLEGCGAPPDAPSGGAWINSEMLQTRLIDLETKQRKNFTKLIKLGVVRSVQTMKDGSPLKHAATHRDITTTIKVTKRSTFDLGIPKEWSKADNDYFEKLEPWPLRGPCKIDHNKLRDIEQGEDFWMMPMWFDDKNETIVKYIAGVEFLNEMLKEGDTFTWLIVGPFLSLPPVTLALTLFDSADTEKIKQNLLSIQKADKAPLLVTDYTEGGNVAAKARREAAKKKGLIFGFRMNSDPKNVIESRLPETIPMREKMIQYYMEEKSMIEETIKIIKSLLVEKKLEEEAEAMRIKQAGAGDKPNCHVGDSFSPEFSVGTGTDRPPTIGLKRVYFDKVTVGGLRTSTKKNMKDHKKKPVWARADLYDIFTKIIEIANNLGAVVGDMGIHRPLNAKVTPGRSAVSYHYLHKALDLLRTGSTLVQGKFKLPDGKYDLEKIKQNTEYVVVKEGNVFRVWAKSSQPVGTKFGSYPFEVQRVTLDAQLCHLERPGPSDVRKITGNYIDLTSIFLHFGFKRVPYRGPWKTHCRDLLKKSVTGVNMTISEFWHFEYNSPKGTVWESALKTIYTDSQLRGSPPMRTPNYVVRRGQFRKPPKGGST